MKSQQGICFASSRCMCFFFTFAPSLGRLSVVVFLVSGPQGETGVLMLCNSAILRCYSTQNVLSLLRALRSATSLCVVPAVTHQAEQSWLILVEIKMRTLALSCQRTHILDWEVMSLYFRSQPYSFNVKLSLHARAASHWAPQLLLH